MLLQNYNMEKLQTVLSCWPSKEQELLSISIGRTDLKAVLFVKEGEAGVDFSYSYLLADEAQDFAWLGDAQALEKSLSPLYKALQKEGYIEAKLKAVITLEEYAFSERLDLPELEKKELDEALNWEVPEHIPWAKDSYSFQYAVMKLMNVTESQLRSDALAKLQQVYVYAMENTCIEALVKASKVFSWELVAIAVAEAFSINEQYSEQLSLVDFYEAHYTEEQLAERREIFAVPLITAMAYLDGRLDINFLPREDKYRVKLEGFEGVFKWLSCFCLGASFLLGALAYGYHYQETEQLKALMEKEASMAIWQGRMQELKLMQTKEERLRREIEQLAGRKLLWSSLMKDFGRLLPQGVWLTKVYQQAEGESGNNKGVSIVLQGKALSAELVTQLLQSLEQSKNLHRIELVNSDTETRGGKALAEEQVSSFTIKAEFKQASAAGIGKAVKKNKTLLGQKEAKNDVKN